MAVVRAAEAAREVAAAAEEAAQESPKVERDALPDRRETALLDKREIALRDVREDLAMMVKTEVREDSEAPVVVLAAEEVAPATPEMVLKFFPEKTAESR